MILMFTSFRRRVPTSNPKGDDLNVVNLLQSQWGSLFTNTEDFTGAPSVSQNGNNIVYVSQETGSTIWGICCSGD